MATPTTGTLLNNYFDSLTSFFIEMGNMVYNIKKCREETNPDKKADYLIQASISFGLATESIATLINGPMGGKIGIAGNTLIGGRLLINVTKFTEEWSDGKIDINRTQNIMADFFTLTGSALSMSKNPVKKGIGLGAKKVGDIIGAIALKTGETGTISKEDFFNGENFKNFIIDEYLQPLSDAIYDLFDQIDNRISSLLNNQDDSWIQLIIDKLDSQRLTELPEGSLVQHAVIAQLNDWYYYKVTNNEYNGEKFFSDNKDVLQYTTAQGEGFLNVSSKSDKYIDNFLIYVSRQLCDNEFLLWSFIKSEQHQWNIVTNTKGGNATAMDNEKTQFMLGNDGNDTLIGGDLNDIIIGSNGNDYLYGGLGSDKLYGGAGFDTYEFKTGEMNWDYIYDHNGDGQVIIDGINFSIFKFTKKPNADSIWEYKIGSNNWWAMLNENGNLILMLGRPNRIVIENYKSMGGNKLGITLSDEVTGENQTNYLLWEGDVRPETDEDGKYLVNWLDHAERDINGVLIKGTKQVGFNDVMAGLAGLNNKIYGLAGNDALHGRDKDDIIDGGDDDDLIAG
ncbi:MAG: hypothetical protein IKI22_01400, partial [Neisseriaceae bacterium]|nr:hypothetical protein [Neisseriaceae bacterium]